MQYRAGLVLALAAAVLSADIAEAQFHTFSIVYFHLMMYLHPDRALSLDIAEETLEKLKPFTDAALTILADTADPFEVEN